MAEVANENGIEPLVHVGQKHALVMGLCSHAHTAGIYRLALQLARRGVMITFLGSVYTISQIEKLDYHNGLPINFLSFDPSFVAPPQITRLQNLLNFIDAHRLAFLPIVERLRKLPQALSGPTCVIVDRFCAWMKDVKRENDLPMYMFFSCGANSVRFSQACPRACTDGTFRQSDELRGTLFQLRPFEGTVNIEGLPPLRYSELPLMFREIMGFDQSIGAAMAEADAVIVNSFQELEPKAIDTIRLELGNKSSELFLVGPLSSVSAFQDMSFQRSKAGESDDCLRWLDTRELRSVLYISMGTIVPWRFEDVQQLATALQATSQSFLWVLRNSLEALPNEFRERTSSRGLVISGWAPQLRILNHASVGGQLTHCGWNSMMESVTAGQPMIAWPRLSEQHLNCKYFCDVLQVAVPLGQDYLPSTVVRQQEFEEVIRVLMVDEKGKEMRARARELQSRARRAVASGGDVDRALQEIVKKIPGTTSKE